MKLSFATTVFLFFALKLWLAASFNTSDKLDLFIRSLGFGGDRISYRTSRTHFFHKSKRINTVFYMVMGVLICLIYVLSNAIN